MSVIASLGVKEEVKNILDSGGFLRDVQQGPCGFRPFDFYSKLKIENQKFTIEISICLIPQELKITNLQS